MNDAFELKIGLINDIHYDGSARAMNRLYEAVAAVTRSGADGLVVLGDLVNGASAFHARRLLREVAALCESFPGEVHYIPGNHDLDHLSKADFYEALGHPGARAHFQLEEGGHALIFVDGNFSPDGTEYECGNFVWQEAWVPEEQLEWLERVLGAVRGSAVLFSHQRVDVSGKHSVQNDGAVRRVIEASGRVRAVFQGHRHEDDLQRLGGTAYYTLSAHVDGAGPALVCLDEQRIRLVRDCDS